MDKVQVLLSSLVYTSHSVRLLHWNTAGLGFDPVHTLLGEYYDMLDGFTDEVAELGKSIGVYPVSLFESLRIITDCDFQFKDIPSKSDYDTQETFESLYELFNTLITVYESIYNDSSLPADICNKLQEHCYELRKNNHYKGRQRLKK